MPANRASKNSRDSKSARDCLAHRIDLRGSDSLDDIMPCTPCFRLKTRCVMSEGSPRCSACVRRARPCDGVFVGASLTRATSVLSKIERQEDDAEEALALAQEKALKAHREATEALARLTRLRKQKRLLRAREKELFDRGMQELDEEDGIAEVNADLPDFSSIDVAHLESEAVGNALSVGAMDAIDWSVVLTEVPVEGTSSGRSSL